MSKSFDNHLLDGYCGSAVSAESHPEIYGTFLCVSCAKTMAEMVITFVFHLFFATDIWCSFFPIWSLPKIWDEMTPNDWNWKELFFRNFSLFSFYGMFRYGEIGVKSSRYCFCYAYYSRFLMPPCIFWSLDRALVGILLSWSCMACKHSSRHIIVYIL